MSAGPLPVWGVGEAGVRYGVKGYEMVRWRTRERREEARRRLRSNEEKEKGTREEGL
jgi:hypothetical protein